MKAFLIIISLLFAFLNSFGQNQNVSNGNIFDGEPYLSINPSNPQHMVVAWMGYLPFTNVFIKTKVSFDAGQSWSTVNNIPHTNLANGSADPSIEFDNLGNVFIAYIDYSSSIDSGAVYVVKSTDGGLNWGTPVEIINAHSDIGKYPIDRPWISIDRSGGVNNGNIYITTMPPNVFGPLLPPYHPYFMVSTNSGSSFSPWQYLDTTNWLSGNLIPQPMPTNCVTSNGTFHAIYPSYLVSQSLYARYIIASTSDAGNSFTYHTVLNSSSGISDSLAKKGYLLRSNPADANHLAFFYLDLTYGDLDVFMKESFDEGVNWTNATRINDDPIANNRMQDLLWADFDADGDLVVSWRDRRNGTDSTYTTSSEIWGAYRSKDSTNFSSNFQISDNITPYDTILSFAGNDFMCIKLIDDTLSAAWGDTRNGKLNIWFQRMSVNGTILSISQISSENIPDIKIYPNPSVSSITVEGEGIMKTVLLNQNGKVVSTHQNNSASENVMIDLGHLSSGIYFVQVTSSNGIITKKCIKQ
ncbi:MAG: T9SS type A sorting domain-containing protein [Bacteroidales bacterium]|nr:T9SS type A sorting domain-containing protein [Bacteroidales bacterium]